MKAAASSRQYMWGKGNRPREAVAPLKPQAVSRGLFLCANDMAPKCYPIMFGYETL